MLASQAVNLDLGKSLRFRDCPGAGSAGARTFHDVEINHVGGDVGMTKKFLYSPDVGPDFAALSRVKLRFCRGRLRLEVAF